MSQIEFPASVADPTSSEPWRGCLWFEAGDLGLEVGVVPEPTPEMLEVMSGSAYVIPTWATTLPAEDAQRLRDFLLEAFPLEDPR